MINVTKRFYQVLQGLAAIFILMFAFHFFSNLSDQRETYHLGQPAQLSRADGQNHLANIASARYEIKKEAGSGQTIQVDQKYEKIATIRCQAEAFEQVEQTIQTIIEGHDAIVQFQQRSGIDEERHLYLQIGVPPARFEAFVGQLEEQLQLTALEVSKKDKTNEYRELNAKVETLQAARRGLEQLKEKGGSIGEFVELENRILALDEQLRQLGVQLGSFAEENELCTVHLTLIDGHLTRISFGDRLMRSLEWTIQYYALFMLALAAVVIVAYVIVLIVARLRNLQQSSSEMEDS